MRGEKGEGGLVTSMWTSTIFFCFSYLNKYNENLRTPP